MHCTGQASAEAVTGVAFTGFVFLIVLVFSGMAAESTNSLAEQGYLEGACKGLYALVSEVHSSGPGAFMEFELLDYNLEVDSSEGFIFVERNGASAQCPMPYKNVENYDGNSNFSFPAGSTILMEFDDSSVVFSNA